MASKGLCEEQNVAETIEETYVVPDFEPGASNETMLVTTDSLEELEQEMDSSFDERQMKESTTSTISEIQEELNDTTVPDDSSSDQDNKLIEHDEVVRNNICRQVLLEGYVMISDGSFFLYRFILIPQKCFQHIWLCK